jgi:hypothetical protein
MQTDDWVGLSSRFTPGWPWPEDSYGLGPLYGDDGWCRECGTPLGEQTGSLVMQGSKFPTADVWMPNWLFDVVCVSARVADEIRGQFNVTLREVSKPRTGPTALQQLVPERTREAWYRPADLEEAVRSRHSQHSRGRTGATCPACGRWKWLPVSVGDLPMQAAPLDTRADVITSPESFGDGLMSFRHLLFRRALAELLVAANPKHWRVLEVP